MMRSVALFVLYGTLWGSKAVPLDAQTAPVRAPTSPLTLGDAARLAARNSVVAQGAQSRLTQAEARIRQARSALLPDISMFGSDGMRTFNSTSLGVPFPSAPGQPALFDPAGEVVGPKRNVDYRWRVTLPLFDLGAREQLRGARVFAQASRVDTAVVAEQTGTAAAFAYIRVLQAEDEYRARSADSALAADLVHVAQKQLYASVGLPLEVTRTQAQLASTRAQLIASRNRRDRARLELLLALNLPLSTAVTLSDSLESLALGDVVLDERAAVGRALQRRPDLQAAEQRIAAARQSVSTIRAGRLPAIRFVGDYGVNGTDYNRLLRTYTYAVALSVPIFDGALRKGRLQEQAAQLHETEVLYEDLRNQVEADVRLALLDLASAQEQVDASREALKLAEQAVVQARTRFQAGTASGADPIVASLAATTARTAMIEALATVLNARIALARAQGSVLALP